jgi:Zn-dependent metalloprotease
MKRSEYCHFNKFIFGLFILLSFNALALGQLESKNPEFSDSDKKGFYQDILNAQLSKVNHQYNPVSQKQYNHLLNANFSLVERPFFKVLKETANDEVWITGHIVAPKNVSLEQKAKLWVEAATQHLGYANDEFGVDLIGLTELEDERHVRLRQTYKGKPIYGAEMILHEKQGRFHMMNGKLLNVAELLFSGKEKRNIEEVKIDLSNKFDSFRKDVFDFGELGLLTQKKQWDHELLYYPQESAYRLCFHIKMYPNLAERYELFVDAQSGEVIDSVSSICKLHHHLHTSSCNHTGAPEVQKNAVESSTSRGPKSMNGPATAEAEDLNGSMRLINTYEFDSDYYLIDAAREMYDAGQSVLPDDPRGAIWTIDLNNTSPVNENSLYTHVNSFDNSWGETPEGVSAHYNAGKAYEYYLETFNRNAITGTGETILSFVNVSDPDENSLGNAFWNGLGIFYGNGDSFFKSLGRALDVAGHEMSHGVIEATANLEYRNESGAMNEAFADIFGAMIDRDDWTIGEEVVRQSAFPSGALRDLSDPHNGAATGDFQSGWQPRHVNERFTGTENNGGVHINSGIINYAFYLFARDVGRSIAEQVYYRALNVYLTRSSGFNELRFAVVQSALDLYDNSVAAEARAAFDEVGIIDESEGEFQEDLDINSGEDLLLVSDQTLETLYIFDLESGDALFNPLSNTPMISKPSITDDGRRIVFVGTDNHVRIIDIDWLSSPLQAQESIISNDPIWRNAVISKDGRFIALLENVESNSIVVFDIETGNANEFFLYNPTYTQGINTGEVRFADVMEFDATGTRIMYDAYNRVEGSSGEIEFWDIGFVEVWNKEFDTWALGEVDKLFGNLPEGVNIANPTFSKNSPFIIALDVFDGLDFEIVGLNLETQELNSIFFNTGLSYPSYSREDDFLIYDLEFFGYTDLGLIQLNDNKISSITDSDQILLPGGKWGTWFSNGSRNLTSLQDFESTSDKLRIIPNPAMDYINLETEALHIDSHKASYEILNMNGQIVMQGGFENQLDITSLTPGSYVFILRMKGEGYRQIFIKN